MDETIVTSEAQRRSEFLRHLLMTVAASDISISPDTLRSATDYARRNDGNPSAMASIQAELQVLKSLALDMKAALAAERKRLFDLD